jgi:hypothetical protein
MTESAPYPAAGSLVGGDSRNPDEVIEMACQHHPACPDANSKDARAARVVADHWEQGWALLCNGSLVFDDEGILPPPLVAAA